MGTTSILTIQRGNPYSRVLQFNDMSSGSAVAYPLTGKIILFTIKHQDDTAENDDSALIKKTISVHTDEEAGTSLLELTGADTLIAGGSYKGDIRLYQASPLVQLNSAQFICEINDIVTKRTA